MLVCLPLKRRVVRRKRKKENRNPIYLTLAIVSVGLATPLSCIRIFFLTF